MVMSMQTQNIYWSLAVTLFAILVSGYVLYRRKKTTPRNALVNSREVKAVNTQQPKQTSLANLPPGENYEVFLSFRGKDTRKGFTDHLYNGLVDAGVWVFRDDDELPVGETIGPELLKAIEGSKISIPIISEDYASSKWCLQELVQMLECKRRANQIILPIFYKVEPSDVRHLSGRFGEAFASHRKQHSHEVVEKWKTALREVGSLKGWESEKIADGHEGELVKLVIRKVLLELKKAYLIVSNNLVGVDDHVRNIMEILDANSYGAHILGIHGMGGIGKTTLAKIIYNKLCEQFEYCSFLADIRATSSQHKGLVSLQRQLVLDLSKQVSADISNTDEGIKMIKGRLRGKKVLVLLDDVDDGMQLNNLVGDDVWFGLGSIIIITTRNKQVLKAPEVNLTYELKELDIDQSLLLFSKHAFRRDNPLREYASVSKGIVSTTGGLPLAIEIIGSFLHGKSEAVWKDTLEKLKRIPNQDVQKTLRVSFDALNHEAQQIFLDIACLPIQTKTKYAVYMWTDCGYFPINGIEVLCLMSLVKVGKDDDLRMHDQLRDLGREIVREECYEDPGNRSRLWRQEEALDVLEGMQGTGKVKALCLDFAESLEGNNFSREHFQNLTRLRFLQMNYATLNGDFMRLFRELRWLQWQGCPSDFMLSNFHPKNLVVLDLSHSEVTEHWGGWKQIELAKRLKVLRLENCLHLIVSPDFSPFMQLEILILEKCKNLQKIHQSVGNLKTLVTLNIRGCEQLKELPAGVGQMKNLKELLVDQTSVRTIPVSEGSLGNLEVLSAYSCSSLVQLPSSISHLTSLSELNLSACENLTQLPDSIGFLVRLSSLLLHSCTSMTVIPESIGKLKSLTKLDLSFSLIKKLPDSTRDLGSLEVLDISFSTIKILPGAIRNLGNLKELYASCNPSLQAHILSEIAELSSLHCLQLEETNISVLPRSLYKLSSLQTLNLRRSHMLESLPELPSGLSVLKFSGYSMEVLPNISNLTNLKDLEFSDTLERGNRMLNIAKLNKLERLTISESTVIAEDLGTFPELKMLTLKDVNISSLLIEASTFYKLRELYVIDCKLLDCLPALPSGLVKLHIRGCPSLKKLADLSNLKHLSELWLFGCSELIEITGLEGLESLRQCEFGCRKLSILEGLGNLASLWELVLIFWGAPLPDLSNLKNLTTLKVKGSNNIISIQGLNSMKRLETLEIDGCRSVEGIGDLSGLKALKNLSLLDCPKLHSVEGIEKLTSLELLSLIECKFMDNLPDLSNLRNLEELTIRYSDELVQIPGLEQLKSLRELEISFCASLESLPDFSTYTALRSLRIQGCEKLKELRGLESLKSSCEFEIDLESNDYL